jgi:pyruvyl transferase EpsO
MDHVALVRSLAAEIERTLGPLVAGARRIALLDHPDYANVGDSAIWLGERAFLAARGLRPAYAASQRAFRAERLRARVGDGPILLSGGGNLGDLWEHHQLFREAVIRAFPRNPIVQLPQSICFTRRESLARARAVFDAHPRLVLLVRDRRSLELARSEFRAPALLCPDMALCLGPQPRPAPARGDCVFLLRTDAESALDLRGAALGSGSVDWKAEPRPPLRARLQRWLERGAAGGGVVAACRSRSAEWTYASVARLRLARGLARLAAGRRVVTDRLHGHVLCLLLGIPHVLLDDRHGKLRAFFDTWTRHCDLARFAADLEEAGLAAACV